MRREPAARLVTKHAELILANLIATTMPHPTEATIDVFPGQRAVAPAAVDLGPLRVLLARIRERYRPEEVWLFGSRARGDAREGSDWDLLVVVPDDTDDRSLHPLVAWRLQKGSGIHADVIPCRASDFRADIDTVNTLAYAAVHEGVRIDER